MILIWTGDTINDSKVKIVRSHSQPENLTEEQKDGGILVNEVSLVQNEDPNKTSVMYFNPIENSVFYEFVDRPLTTEERLTRENLDLKDRIQATEDMLLMLMDMQMPM